MAPDEYVDEVLQSIARECARGVRGCCTDEQYIQLVRRIVLALQAERDDARQQQDEKDEI